MNIIEKLKLWYKYKSTENIDEYKSCIQAIESINNDMKLYRKTLSDATQKFHYIQKRYPMGSQEYNQAENEMYRWKYILDETSLLYKFIRPNSQEDIEYRDKISNEYVDELKKVLSPNFDLRFHGSPIYFTKEILKSGCISSTADRYDGYIKSTDRVGEISVSDRESINQTINFFSDLAAYNRKLPCGCIFAILPNGNEDPATHKSNLMPSVNFREHPEQLFGIVTTPENIEQVKGWMSKYEFNPDLIYTFEEFLEIVKEKSKEIDNQLQLNSNENLELIDINEKNTEIHDMDSIVGIKGLGKLYEDVTEEEIKQAIDVIKSTKKEMEAEKFKSNKTEERE